MMKQKHLKIFTQLLIWLYGNPELFICSKVQQDRTTRYAYVSFDLVCKLLRRAVRTIELFGCVPT